MSNSTSPIGTARPPASSSRIIPPGLRRLAAGAWLAAALASTAGAASASAGVVPYSITEIGPAPATGFSISDIGAVPTPGYHSPDTVDAPAEEVEVGDLNSR
ncbi:MAG: hypothetical protein F4Y99_08280 [Acidimicrobiaceae bacterium]|nr:hypothetical protein [Acidimicrobiaceae bacterium]MYF41933.1 hypothetical protein [Acidimicrobiaceae bacterium]